MTLTPEQIDLLKRLQPLFKEKMGNIKTNDMIYNLEWKQTNYVAFSHDQNMFQEDLRIPLIIDWQNPERGLWGMVNWWKFSQETEKGSGDIGIYKLRYIRTDPPTQQFSYVGAPFTALLKALAEQEGYER